MLAILAWADVNIMFATGTAMMAEMWDTARELIMGTSCENDEHGDGNCCIFNAVGKKWTRTMPRESISWAASSHDTRTDH